MKSKIYVLFVSLCMPLCSVRADNDCLNYKLTPKVDISVPQWTKQVVQPFQEMDLYHGNVIATLVDNYEIVADVTPIEDGFCVGLKSVDATVGYSDFLVQIDIRHKPESCSYNVVLSHEDEHIRAYLSIIDEFQEQLHNSVFSAADSITPVFVKYAPEIDGAIDVLNVQLQSHPDLILVKQQIKAAEEIRNKHVDINDDGSRMRQCMN